MQVRVDNLNDDLDQELEARQQADFEEQYLGLCLRTSRREISINIGKLSQTQSVKSIEQFEQAVSPKLENITLKSIQQSNTPETNRTLLNIHTPTNKQRSTGASLMAFFLIKRFLDKLQIKRKMIETLNYTHLNLIGDKASDINVILLYGKSIQRVGYTIQSMKKLLKMDSSMEETKLENMKQSFKNIKKRFIKYFEKIIDKIPLIQPESMLKMYWDLFATCFRIILIVLIPLEISFETLILFGDNSSLSILIIIVLVLDFIFRINTQQYQGGRIVRDRWQLMLNSAKQSMLIDFVTIFILCVYLALDPLNKYYNLFTLFTLTQYSYVYDVLSRTEQLSYLSRPQRGTLGLIKFLAALLYIVHIFSCIWFWFSGLSIEDSWITFKDLNDKNWSYQYLEAFYFAIVTMLTIGYGDNVPKNSIEKVVAIIFILGACLWFSYSINFIGGIINDITQNQLERNQKMRVINKYMAQRAIPFALQHQIREYLIYRWKEDDEIDLQIEQTLLEQLSDELKEELDKQAHKVFIQKSILLQQVFSEEFRNALFKSIKRMIIPPQNTFQIDFNGQHHLCYIEQGHLLYQHKEEKQRSKMNTLLRQGEFLCVKEFIEEDPDIELFKAVGYVSLLILSKQDFLLTLKDYPDDYQKYCQLKDSIMFNVDQTILNKSVYCPACQNFEHKLAQCPYIQLCVNKEMIIKRFQWTKIQTRTHFKRKRQNHKNNIYDPLPQKELFAEYAKAYVQDNQNAVNQQLKIQNYQDSDLMEQSATASIEPPSSIEIPRKQLPFQTPQLFIGTDLLNSVRIQRNLLKETDIDLKGELRQQFNQTKVIRKTPMYSQKPIIKKKTSTIYTMKDIPDEIEEEYTQLIKSFQEHYNENVILLYNKLNKQEEEDQFVKNALLQLQPIYWKINCKPFDEFDILKNYDYYFQNNNVFKVVDIANKNIHAWQKDFIETLQKYMFFPFNYILKYLKLRRNRMVNAIIETGNKFRRAKNKLRMLQLRNSLLTKKFSTTSSRNIKIAQVIPFGFPSKDSIIT